MTLSALTVKFSPSYIYRTADDFDYDYRIAGNFYYNYPIAGNFDYNYPIADNFDYNCPIFDNFGYRYRIANDFVNVFVNCKAIRLQFVIIIGVPVVVTSWFQTLVYLLVEISMLQGRFL